MNRPTFIQWNCRGFKVNFNELSLLIQNPNPVALCLQETHLKDTDNIRIKNYTIYNHYAQADRASGGSSIAIHNNYIHSQINLTTNLFLLCNDFMNKSKNPFVVRKSVNG